MITLLIASLVVFGSIYLAPGKPADFLTGGRVVSPQALAAINAQYHLGRSFPVEYWYWLSNIAHGDLGRSIEFRQPVAGLIDSRVPVTAFLVTYAAVIVLLFGLGLGALAAVARKRVDELVTAVLTTAAAIPAFVAGLALIFVFAIKWSIFPSGGQGSGFVDRLDHMTLPAIALALSLVAVIARVTRSSMRLELRREHVEVARSRGLSEHRIVVHHVFWNSLTPVLTISVLVVAGLLSGTAVVETIFGLHGLGSLLVDAVQTKDFPIVQGVTLIFVGIFVVANIVVDLLYALVNPRIRARMWS